MISFGDAAAKVLGGLTVERLLDRDVVYEYSRAKRSHESLGLTNVANMSPDDKALFDVQWAISSARYEKARRAYESMIQKMAGG